jgi:hypothetical protein
MATTYGVVGMKSRERYRDAEEPGALAVEWKSKSGW